MDRWQVGRFGNPFGSWVSLNTVRPIQFVAFVVPTVASNYWIYLVAAIFGPLQGFLNAVVVFLRDRRALQKRASDFFKTSKFRFGTSATNSATSSYLNSAPMKGGGGHISTDKKVDAFATNEEAAQLEVSIGQLASFHEDVSIQDGLPSEDVGGSRGHIFDESIALFEHALNSGLVTEDDIREYANSMAHTSKKVIFEGNESRGSLG